MDSLGESMSDYEVVCKIAERLGMLEEYTGGLTVPEIIKLGWEQSGSADKISWEDLNEKGYYVVPPDPDWESIPPASSSSTRTGGTSPLHATGKLEFYSTGLAEHFPTTTSGRRCALVAQGESHRRPSAPSVEEVSAAGHEQPSRWGCTSQHDDVTGSRDRDLQDRGADGYQYHRCGLTPRNAGARGVEHGDVVAIFNERGTVLAGAYVTSRIMPGR